MSLPGLETGRLWLEPLVAAHADDLHVARGDAEAMRYWAGGVSPSLEATREEIGRMASWRTQWAFGRRGESTALGFVGFHGLGPGEQCGFGYCLRRGDWGQGLTAEAAGAALDYGFGEVAIAHAEMWIDPRNSASVRVAEKCRATLRGWAATGGTLSLIYGITAADWAHRVEPPAHLNVVPVLEVSDVDRGVSLWRDGLSFRVGWTAGTPPSIAQMLCEWTGGAGVRLASNPRPKPSTVSIRIGRPIDEVVERAVVAGWRLANGPAPQRWGTTDAELVDEDGNRIILTAPPRSTHD